MNNSDDICPSCCGSGEGQYDGTICHACKGRGVAPDYESEYEAKCEAADRWYDERKDRESESYL